MLRVSRFKFLIFATIVCVILSCIAAFSVSLAKWTLDDNGNVTKEIKGNAANFYVEYPQYVSGSEEGTQITVPSLSATKYYMQVPQRDNTGMADFYEFKDHKDNEKKLNSIYLYPNDVLSMFYGKTNQSISKINGGTAASHLTLSDGKITVNTEGFYDFYYVVKTTTGEDGTNATSMWANYIGKPSDDNNQGNTIDTTGFTELFSIKFSDDDQVKKLYFKTGTNASSPYNSLDNFAVHIRKRDPGAEGYYYNTNTYPGKTGAGDGNMRYVRSRNGSVSNPLEGQTLYVGTKAETVIIFGFEEAHMSNADTHSGVQDLKEYAVGETNLIILHTAKNVAPKLKTSGLGGGSNPADDLTPIAPDYEGTTDFHNGGTVQETLNTKKTVRQVTSGAQESGTRKYIYKNYICVSRKNSAATDDDNSIAYLEFAVSDSTINPYYVRVTSLTLKRRATDANGNIKDRFVNPAPRIYNYDSNLDTRLGPDTSNKDYSNPNKEFTTDEDKAAARKPLFAIGKEHTSFESNVGKMKKHYDDGVYAVLYFGDNDQQYFALDITIELEITSDVDDDDIPDEGLDFTLKAKLANVNSWERYEDGYGEPWGFYMGGLINSVETWDPSRTTKLERATDRYVTNYSATFESQKIKQLDPASNGDIEKASQAALDAFNALPVEDFNYNIIKFHKASGEVEGFARYPKGKVDVSLTVNLTEGSLIKMYMLDHDGDRKGGSTVWIVPSEILYDRETKLLFRDETYDIYDSDVNIIIPKTGTYIFRLVGYFRTRNEEVEDSNGNILTGDKICFEDGKRYEAIPSGKHGKALDNFNFWVDKLYITCSSAGEGNSDCTIKLNANGGAFEAKDLKGDDTTSEITRIVTFGSDIRNLPQPTNGDKKLLGWYYEEDGNTVDFDFGSAVTGSMTLKAKWSAQYLVTFDANDGTLPNGVTNPIQTDIYGNLTKAQWDSFKPTRSGHKFLGWYTAQTGGTKLGTDTTFTADRTVYAHWEELTDGVFINGAFAKALTDKDSNEVQALAVKITSDTAVVIVKYNQTDCSEPKAANAFKSAYSDGKLTLGRGEYDFYYKHKGGDEGLWIVGRLEIVFNANGGKFSDNTTTKSASTGEVANSGASGKLTESAIPANPTNADMHYKFDSWNTKADGSGTKYTSVTSSTGFTSGMTLYAQWKKVAFDISFDLNGGTGTAPASITTNTSGKLTSLPSPEPTRPDYHFAGWYTAKTDGSKVTTTSNNTFTSDATLYAHWDKQFTITYNANGSGATVNPTSDTTNSATGKLASLPTPTRTGYHFVGWFTTESGGEQITTNTEFTENKTIYAHWDKQFTITFDANGSGATVNPTSDTTDAATGKLASLPTPTRENYRFKGWYTTTTGNTEITTAYTFSGNTTVHAQWDQLFTITFDANGSGATVNPTSDTTDSATGKLASLPTPTRTGHRFDYWQTAADGGTPITTGTVFGSDTTIYAKWVEQVTVTFDGNGGTWSDDSTPHGKIIDKGSKVTAIDPPDNAPDGKAFDCWSTSNTTSGGAAFDFEKTTIDTDITLHAQWKEASEATTYRVILDVSNWPGYDHANAYTYHIYANGTGDGDEMVSKDSNKFYFDLTDTTITKIRFTQDQKDTHNELSRHEVSVSGLTLGGEYTYTPTINNVTIDGTRQIGLQFTDGIVILNASYNTGWTDDDHPNQIYMWKKVNGDDTPITAAWSAGQAGDNIAYGKFKKYNNVALGDVYGIILAQNGNGWTGDIKPGQENYDSLANGKVYNIKYGEFKEKTFSGGGGGGGNITIRFTGPYWADAKSARVSYVTDNSTVNDDYDSALEMTWESDYSGYIVIPKPTKIRMFFKQDIKWISSEITMSFESGKTYTMTNAQYTSDGNNTKNFTASITVS